MRGSLSDKLLADRYAVESPIGQGRSTVYRGTDTRLRRPVALKQVQLSSDHESLDRVRRRTLREAQAAARLDNPSVVTVYDVIEEDGAIWLVMELVDAPSLAQLVGEHGLLDHARAARIGLDLLSALDAAHRIGVVHRDVKPANVLVPDGGRGKLADFGVAAVRDETRVTATGLVLGSPAFMAPEQARGEQVGPPADLWALGATLYFAIEGAPPFDGGSAMATALAVVHGEPRPEQNPGPLSAVVRSLLDKDAARRPDAEELRSALAAVAGGDAATTPATTVPVAAAPVAAPSPTAATELVGTTEPDPEVAEPAEPAESTARFRPVASAEPSPVNRVDPQAWPGVRRRNPTRTLIKAAIAVVLLALVVAALMFDPDDLLDSSDPGTTAPPGTSAEPDAAAPEPTAPSTTIAEDDEDDDAEETPTEEAPDVPEGWQAYTDPSAGYTIAYPAGWEVRPGNPRTDFVDPETGTFLRVDWTDQPRSDPVADWEQQAESFAGSHDGYEEIRIEQYDYRDYNAAMWEFRYDDDGARQHAADLGFVAGDRGYALYFHTRDDRWSAGQDTFSRFQEAFQPAGG